MLVFTELFNIAVNAMDLIQKDLLILPVKMGQFVAELAANLIQALLLIVMFAAKNITKKMATFETFLTISTISA